MPGYEVAGTIDKVGDGVDAVLVGMNLIVENVAHSLFTTLMDNFDEPVLQELLHYIDLDEVKHVALARNYLPRLLKDIGPVRRTQIYAKQAYWNYVMFRAQDRIMKDTQALMIDWNAQMKRDMKDMRNMFRELPPEAQRISLFKPPSKELTDKIADWLLPPEKFAEARERSVFRKKAQEAAPAEA